MAVVERSTFGDHGLPMSAAAHLRGSTAAVLAVMFAAALPCQVVRSPEQERSDPNLHPLAPREIKPPDEGFQPLESVEPKFQGFPTFPPNLSGYGGYPQIPERLLEPPDLGSGRAPPPLRAEPPDWPSWVRVAGRRPLPYAPDAAVVLRDAERVWYRTGADEPFVPLSYYDKLRPVPEGGQVQVRGVGEFKVLFHGGTFLRSFGRADLLLGEMSEAKVELYLLDFSDMLLLSRSRPAWLHLPDGNVVVTEVATERGCDLEIERDGERGYLVNHGPNNAILRTPYGEFTLEPAHRILVFMVGPGPVYSGPLRQEGGVSMESEDNRITATAGAGGGVVEWCGARIRLPQGSTLELDPLQGRVHSPDGGND